MANTEETRRARARRDRERQYQIDRITARYEDEYRAGRSPRLEDYLQQYPEYSAELIEFTLYFHAHVTELPEPDALPAAALSPAAQRALARIRGQSGAASAQAPAPIEGLIQQGLANKLNPQQLAASVGISTDLLGKLQARVIAVATIPPTLTRRLAQALKVAPEAISAYLGGAAAPQAGGAFFYADSPPQQQQESFLTAMQASALPPERKQEWQEIVQREIGGG